MHLKVLWQKETKLGQHFSKFYHRAQQVYAEWNASHKYLQTRILILLHILLAWEDQHEVILYNITVFSWLTTILQ